MAYKAIEIPAHEYIKRINVTCKCTGCGQSYRSTQRRAEVVEFLLGIKLAKCGACGRHSMFMSYDSDPE